ncbi:MAG: hypothetical protein JNL88_07650 [Bacteroidia bacterium]|nr:hypothetical protein [Bacteroidia bacterium]
MRKLISTYVLFRLRQASREWRSLGPVYGLLITLFTGAVLYLFMMALRKNTHPGLLFTLSCLPLLLKYSTRKDFHFLHQWGQQAIVLRIVDYLLPGALLLFIYLMNAEVVLSILYALIVVMFAVFPLRMKGRHGTGYPMQFLPAMAYEWRAGIRRNFLPVCLLVLAILASVSVPVLPLAFTWLLHVVILSFYSSCESRALLCAPGYTAAAYLFSKCRIGFTLQSLLFLPLLAFYISFQPGTFWLAIFFYGMSLVSLLFTIVTKYLYYEPSRDKSPAQVFQIVSVLSFIIPFLIPIPFFLNFLWYKKAVQRIDQYVA